MNNHATRVRLAVWPIAAIVLSLTAPAAGAAPVSAPLVRAAAESFVSLRYPATSGQIRRTVTALGASPLGVLDVNSWQPDGETIAFLVDLTPTGFVLMRSDDRLPPLKVYSDRGRLTQLPPDFVDVLAWELTRERDHLLRTTRGTVPDSDTHLRRWQALCRGVADEAVLAGFSADPPLPLAGPLLETTWNQNSPYNYYAPAAAGGSGGRALAGCVACAMAQILNHHEAPKAISQDYTYVDSWGSCTGSRSCSEATLNDYDWANMPAALSGGSSAAEKHAVGQLMYHCGVTVNMDFEAGSSGAYPSDTIDALRCFFLHDCGLWLKRVDYSDAEWYAKIHADITAARPIFYEMASSLGNHALVCDGCRNGNEIHLDFGWSGASTAWYDMDNVSEGGRLWYYHGAIFGIEPGGAKPAYELTVQSANPHHAVPVSVSLADSYGQRDGQTPFVRTYPNGTTVTLTAPARVDGENFDHWELDGLSNGTSRTLLVAVSNVSHRAEAVFDVSSPPRNDAFRDAPPLSGATGMVYGNSVLGTAEAGEPDHAGLGLGGPFCSVWWCYQPPVDGYFRVDTHGSTFDTILAVYAGSELAALHEIGSNDDDSHKPCSGVSVWLSSGICYRLAVSGCHADDCGDITLRWTRQQGATNHVALGGGHNEPFLSWQDAATNIQDAIAAADDGNLVLVSNDVYYLTQQITVNKAVHLAGLDRVETVIDGQDATRCLRVTAPALLTDLTIRNGFANGGHGGGVWLDGYGTVQNCRIDQNRALRVEPDGGQAGGVFCEDGGVVDRSVVCNNEAKWGGGVTLMRGGILRRSVVSGNRASAAGGGINCDSAGLVIDCTISNNVAGDQGGGVECYMGGTLRSCRIVGNRTRYGGGICFNWGGTNDGGRVYDSLISRNVATNAGGGANCDNAGTLENCVVTENASLAGAGGIECWGGGWLRNCTIARNSAATSGGGVVCDSSGVLVNTILYFNSAPTGPDYVTNGAGYSFSHCCATPLLTIGTGHVDGDPLFVDAVTGNYRLASGSSCIDRGDSAGAPPTDADGVARPLDGDGNGSVAADIGAYESVHPTADSDGDTLPDEWELRCGLDPTSAAGHEGADGDPDCDGLSNGGECIADTLPLDARSVLAITDLATVSGGVAIRWKGGCAATQIVERHVDIRTAAGWDGIHTNVPDTPVTNEFTDLDPAAPVSYYRIRAVR